MSTRELIVLSENVIAMEERYSILLEFLSMCGSIHSYWETHGDRLERTSARKGTKVESDPGKIIDSLKTVIFKPGIGPLYRQIHQCEQELQELAQTLNWSDIGIGIIHNFISKLSRLEGLLQSFLSTLDIASTLTLAKFGGALHYDYLISRNDAQIALDAMEPRTDTPSGMDTLTIFIPFEQTYREVVDKLAAIADIYDEVCALAGVSPAEFPLQISKIESGSLWLKLFGESKVIALVTKLIEKGANFTYRNFTQEGKLREMPRNIETIRVELKLLEELDQAGIPTANLRENIEKSAVIISGKINTLLSRASEITVNEKSYGVKQELDRLIKEHSKVRLIEDGSQHHEPDGEEPAPQSSRPRVGNRVSG